MYKKLIPLIKKRSILSRISPAMKVSIVFLVASLIQKGFAFITSPIFTRLLSQEEFGYVSAYYSLKEVLGIVAMFCLSYGIFNIGMVDHKNDRDVFTLSLLLLSNIITFFVFIITMILNETINIGIERNLLIVMFITFLFIPATQFWLIRQRFDIKYKSLFWYTIISTISSALIPILLLLFSDLSNIYARIIGSEFALVIFDLIFFVHSIKKAKCKIKLKFCKEAFLFNIPLIPHYLSTYVLSASDKLMIKAFVGDAPTALYSMAYTIGGIVLIIWVAINISYMPFIFERCADKDFERLSNSTIGVVGIMILFCLGVFFFAPELLKIISTSEYYNCIYAIPPIIGGVYFSVLYYLFSNIIFYKKKQVFVMIASVFSALLNIILNYLLIPKYGYIIAAYTTLICYFFQALIDYVVMRLITRNKIYNTKVLVVSSLFMVVLSVFGPLVYTSNIIRYSLIALTFLVCLIFSKKIYCFFKKNLFKT